MSETNTPKNHKLFYGSSYDRGLDILLNLWPKIKEKFPDATLDVAYGWDLFIKGYSNNPERMNWMDRINKLMTQDDIYHHGRVGKEELGQIRSTCGIWVYPTYFPEINCITALECQRDGLVPVTMNSFALTETVGAAGRKIDGDIYDDETQESFLNALFLLMKNSTQWELASKSVQAFAENYDWEKIAKEWREHFK